MILPSDLCNRALDSIGLPEKAIGSIDTDGTTQSEIARRHYEWELRALLRTAHWAFARRQGELELLADATGSTLDPITNNPISTAVEPPWQYAYAWPVDGVQARWMPWNGIPGTGTPSNNIALPPTPLMTGLQSAGPWMRQIPARFLDSTSSQFPIASGSIDWPNLPDTDGVEGVALTRRRIILTNVPPWYDSNNVLHGARFVYTALVAEPELWDSLFHRAFVALLASWFAVPMLVDPDATSDMQAKQRVAAVQVRNAQIAIATTAIREARVASANEAGFPQSVDHTPDWIKARRVGGGRSGYWGGAWAAGGEGPGYLWCGWQPIGLADGGVF